ncbi:MAG TPA: FAD-dependent oxidoreductase [Abditibacteriaceae bacterium]|jgi:hypothetical protein
MDSLDFDVVVCGGGPTGVMAATAAARAGAKTLVVERHGFPGGSSTAALVHPWLSFHNKRGEVVLAGLGQELVDRLVACGGSPGHLRDSIGFVYSLTPFDPDLTKIEMQKMLLESGAEVLLHTFITGVERVNDEVRSISVVMKGREETIRARTFIDATGDADIAWRAGAPIQPNRKNGELTTQPLTMNVRLSGVDWEPIRRFILDNPDEFHDETLFDDLRKGEPLTGVSGFFSLFRAANEKLGIPRDRLLFFSGNQPDECYVNTSRVTQLDGSDGFDLSAAELEGRRQVAALATWMKAEVPGFANSYISCIPTQIGVRETRRIEGDYILTQDDVVRGARFADAIARSAYPVDIHAPTGAGLVTSEAPENFYEIPFRSLLPRGLENVIVAGRCISATHEGHASTRLTPTCFAMGQAAGLAAALCTRENKRPRELDFALLRDELRAHNALV